MEQVLTNSSSHRDLFKKSLIVLGLSAIMALSGQVAVPLPFTPIPMALQSHVILFLALLFGGRTTALATLALLVEGMCGLPVFSNGGAGWLVLAGPRGGYLLGYVAAAFITGIVAEKSKKPLLAMVFGNVTIYLFGLPWLALYVGAQNAVLLGMVPFLIGDFLKTASACFLLKGVKSAKRAL